MFIRYLAFSSFIAIGSILISAYFTAMYLKNKNSLPMCFMFDWDDSDDKNNMMYHI